MTSNVYQMAFSNLLPTGEAWHPWHNDKQVAYDGAFSARDALKDNALGGITIKVEPITYKGKAQLRKNWLIWEQKDEVMGFVRNGYIPIQPIDLLGGFLEGMGMSTDKKVVQTAGVLEDGRYWA